MSRNGAIAQHTAAETAAFREVQPTDRREGRFSSVTYTRPSARAAERASRHCRETGAVFLAMVLLGISYNRARAQDVGYVPPRVMHA